MVQPTLWNLPQVLLCWCACFCPEFALPMSIWLSRGWNGLLSHWRAESRAACQRGSAMRSGRGRVML
jgi:hypothetical protein